MLSSIHNHLSIHPAFDSTSGNEDTDRRRVPVLEEAQAQRARGADFVADGLAGGTTSTGNGIAVAGGGIADGADFVASAGALVGGRRGGLAVELGKGQAAGARCGVGGSLELALLGPEEDNGALIAGVRLGDVELEDGAVLAVDRRKVLSTVRGVGRVLVDGHNQVRRLVGAAAESGGASASRSSGWGGTR